MDESFELIRLKLAKDLGLQCIDPLIWDGLVEEGYVADAANKELDRGYPDLLNRAREIYEKGHRDSSPASRLLYLDSNEFRHGWLLERALEQRANSAGPLTEFRASVLGNLLLSDTEAKTFISSEALAVLSLQDMKHHGAPVTSHSAALLEKTFTPTMTSATVHVTPPGVLITKAATHDSAPKPTYSITLTVPNSNPVTRDILPWSVLGYLRRVVRELQRRFAWDEGDITRFVLTGNVPEIRPITAWTELATGAERTRGTITMKIDPSIVSAETVTKTYRNLQEKMIGTRTDKRRTLKPPSIKDQAAYVFAFVEEQSRTDPRGRINFSALGRAWNQWVKQLDESDLRPYSNPERHFKAAYVNAARRFLTPKYRFLTPGVKYEERIRWHILGAGERRLRVETGKPSGIDIDNTKNA